MLHWMKGVAVCAALMGAWLGAAQGVPAAEAEQAAKASSGNAKLVGVVNVNTATPEQLELLPGVGPARARAIVAHRDRIEGFKEPADLLGVKGIGARALEKMRPFVALDGKTTAKPAP